MVFLPFSGNSPLLPDSLVIQGTKHKSTVKSESFLNGDGLASIPIQCHGKWPLQYPWYSAMEEGPSSIPNTITWKTPLQNPQHNAVLCNFFLSENKTTERQYGLRWSGSLLQKRSQENLNLNSNFLKTKISLSDLSKSLLCLPTRKECHVLSRPHPGFRSEGLIENLTPIARGNPFSTQSSHLTKQKRRCQWGAADTQETSDSHGHTKEEPGTEPSVVSCYRESTAACQSL